MFKYFLQDKTSFKNSILFLLIASFCMLFFSTYFYNEFVVKSQANTKALATYSAQAEWLNNYDKEAVSELQKTILSPVKYSEVDMVQKKQLSLFDKHGLKLVSVRKGNTTSKGKIKSISTSIVAEGNWENLSAMLNEFEKNHLVVITKLDLSYEDQVNCKMDFNIYYI